MAHRELTLAEFKKAMKAVKVPEGFEGTFESRRWGYPPSEDLEHSYVLASPDCKIKFDQSGCGHTSFKVADGGWRSFDRRGVEDSFYWHAEYVEKKTPDEHVAEQLAKVADRRKYYETAVPVPGLDGGYTLAPDAVPVKKAELKKKGFIDFYPSGFGTGYVVSKRRRFRYSERAKPELEAFLGVSPLYVDKVDCD